MAGFIKSVNFVVALPIDKVRRFLGIFRGRSVYFSAFPAGKD